MMMTGQGGCGVGFLFSCAANRFYFELDLSCFSGHLAFSCTRATLRLFSLDQSIIATVSTKGMLAVRNCNQCNEPFS